MIILEKLGEDGREVEGQEKRVTDGLRRGRSGTGQKETAEPAKDVLELGIVGVRRGRTLPGREAARRQERRTSVAGAQ